MKKFLVIIIAFSFFNTKAFSQDSYEQRTPEERAKIQTEWMKQNLNLSDEQFEKVEPLNLEYALKMEEVKSIDGKLSKIKKAKSLSDEKDSKLKTILSEEQFEKYLKKRKELGDKMKENRKNSGNF